MERITRQDVQIIGVLFVLALLVNWKLIADGFVYGAYDIGWHLMWIQDFSRELMGGVLYPRWLDYANYGWGSATFVFYPPLSYFLATLLKATLHLDAGDTSTALFFLGIFGGACAFYCFARNSYLRSASLVGAAAYALAPYAAFDIYFRAALAEVMAMIWLPLIFLFTDKSLADCRYRGALSLVFALLALTHLPTFFIAVLFWAPYAMLRHRQNAKGANWTALLLLFLYLAIGAGLAALYIGPALLEQQYVNIGAIKQMAGGWREHMLDAPRVMNFVVLPDVILRTICASVLLALISLAFNGQELKQKLHDGELLTWCGLATAAVLLMSSLSAFIWQAIAPLQMLQFPWRMLTLLSFFMAVLFTICTQRIAQSNEGSGPVRLLCMVVVACLLLTNFMFDQIVTKFRSGIRNITPTLDDGTAPEIITSRIQQLPRLVANLAPYPDVEEYRPLIHSGNASKPVPAPHPDQSAVVLNDATAAVEALSFGVNTRSFKVKSKHELTARVHTYWYPAWSASVDGVPHDIRQADDGAIEITLPAGEHDVQLRYGIMPEEKACLLASMLSLFGLILLSVFDWRRPN